MEHSPLQSALKPIRILYYIYGLNLFSEGDDKPIKADGKALKCCFGFIGVIHCIFVVVGIIFVFIGMVVTQFIFGLDNEDSYYLMSFMISMMIMSAEVLAYEVTIVKKRQEIKELYRKLTEMEHIFSDQRILRKIRLLSVIICTTPLLVAIVVGVILTLTILQSMPDLVKDISDTFDENGNVIEIYVNVSNSSAWDSIFYAYEMYFTFMAEGSFYYAVAVMIFNIFYLIHLKGFILLFCFNLRWLFRALPDYCFNKVPDENSKEEPRFLFIRLHEGLCSLVDKTESIYSFTTLFSYGVEISTIVFILRAANLGNMWLVMEDATISVISLIVPLGLASSFLVCRTKALADVNREISTSLKYLFAESNDGVKLTLKDYFNCVRYVSHVELNPGYMTGCRYFTVKIGYMLAAFGYILTYTLMLYGIQ